MHNHVKIAALRNGFLVAIMLPLIFLSAVKAEDRENLEQKIETVRKQIEQEEETRNRLREDLASMDEKVDNLRQQLDELEAKIGKEK